MFGLTEIFYEVITYFKKAISKNWQKNLYFKN